MVLFQDYYHFLYSQNLGFITKNPPFIHPSSDIDFSLKLETKLNKKSKPNLAGGLTDVNVTNFYFL